MSTAAPTTGVIGPHDVVPVVEAEHAAAYPSIGQYQAQRLGSCPSPPNI